MSKWIYIYPRVNEQDGAIYFQWQDFKAHLAGVEDKSKNWDKFLFTAAKEVLGTEQGEAFKKEFNKVLQYMATMNKIGEVTKEFRPLLTLLAERD